MKSCFLLLLIIFTTTISAQTVVYKSPYKIIYGTSGKPEKLGYWEYSAEKNISRFITNESNLTLKKQGAYTLLIKSKVVLLKNQVPPFGEVVSYTSKTQCSKVDVSQKSGPVREQTSGTCYAYAAMELLNFDLPKTYSALHLAEMYGKEVNKSEAVDNGDILSSVSGFTGGYGHKAMALALKIGLCPEEYIPSIDPNEMNTENYKKILSYYKNSKSQGISGRSVQEACELDQDGVMTAINSLFKGISAETFATLYAVSNHPSVFAESLASEACKNRLEKNIPPGKTDKDIKHTEADYYNDGKFAGVYEEKRKELMNHVNTSLTNGKPVAFSFITGGLILPKDTTTSETNDSNLHGFHTAVVVGRKWVDEERDEKGNVVKEGGCFYLAKNSWGEDWKVPQGVSAKNVTGRPGYFVISEKSFLGHTYDTVSLE